MARVMFRDANWIVFRQIVEAEDVAAIPLGSLEQRGPHLPGGTDAFQVNEMIERALARLPDNAQACVCPTVEYNVVQWASPMASTDISPLHLEQSLVDVCHALTDLGFKKILLVHGHGGIPCGQSAVWQAMQEKRLALYVDFSPFARCAQQLAEICGKPVMHAGCAETSMMLAIRPDLVDMSRAIKGPKDPYGDSFPCPAITGPGCYAIPPLSGTRDGMHGDATCASTDIGNRLLDVLADEIVGMITEMSTSPLAQGRCSSAKVPLPDAQGN